jgi:hypothetical protein
MSSSKSFFLQLLGIDESSTNILHNLVLQRVGEKEPFGEIVTRKDGRSVLRFGAVMEDGITTFVR